VTLLECPEQLVGIPVGQAATLVLDLEEHAIGACVDAEHHGRLRTGELERVLQQIDDNRGQNLPIGANDYPGFAGLHDELEIVRRKAPEAPERLSREVVAFVQKLRKRSDREIFERFPVGYRRYPVYWNGALRLLQQSENFRRSDFLTPIPSAPEANDSFSHRNVSGRERDIPFDFPNRIALVGGDEDDRAGARRRRDFVQGLPRDE